MPPLAYLNSFLNGANEELILTQKESPDRLSAVAFFLS